MSGIYVVCIGFPPALFSSKNVISAIKIYYKKLNRG